MQCKSLWIKASAKCINVNVNVICVASLSEGFGLSRVPWLPSALPTDPLFKIHEINISFKAFRAFCISTQQNHSWKIQLGDTQYIFHPLPPSYMNTHSLAFCLSLSLPLFLSFPGSPAAVSSFVLSISPHPFLLLWIIHSVNTLCKEAILYSHSVSVIIFSWLHSALMNVRSY